MNKETTINTGIVETKNTKTEEKPSGVATINVEVKGIDEANEKVDKLIQKIKEAKKLADELASVDFEVSFLTQDQSSDHKNK